MEFEKLVSPSLKDLFINHIEAMILSGELQVGQQLPPERQLAQSMGVSRAVVNSGIAELEHRGFLEVRPRGDVRDGLSPRGDAGYAEVHHDV